MATDTTKGKVHFFDDFLGDTINLDNYVVNTDSGGTAFAINVQANGVIRATVDTTDNDISNIFGVVIYRSDSAGPLTIEVRAALITSVADGEVFIGFSDASGTDENPITLSTADVMTSNATDAVGFAYTGGGTADWKMVSVANNSDGTVARANAKGATTPAAGTFQTFKITLNEDGDADYYIDGVYQGSEAVAVTSTVLLNFAVALQSGGTGRSLDIDYVEIHCGRR